MDLVKRILLLSIASTVIGMSCNHKSFDLSSYQHQYLVFGQGGGITGLKIEYILTEEGNIYRRHPSDSLDLIKHVDRKFVRQAFDNYTDLGLDSVKCYEPGDLYHYIEYHESAASHRIVWGKPGFTQDPLIVTYFNNLYRTAKKTDK